jgi:hypothetical protein
MKTTNILIVVFICYFLFFLGSLFYYAASNNQTAMYMIGMFEVLCVLGLIVLYLHKKDLKKQK